MKAQLILTAAICALNIPASAAPPQGQTPRWQKFDTNQDGTLSRAEFDAMPRTQRLDPEKRERIFKRLDRDADGSISREEFRRFTGPQHRQKMMRKIMLLDLDQSKSISFEEFKSGPRVQKMPAERQQKLFQRLDRNQDGFISKLDREATKEGIIKRLDQNGDAAVSFDEFRQGKRQQSQPEPVVQERFKRLDRNQDSKLTADDFSRPAPPSDP
ncbi:MAG: hypothetical protein EAZ42_00845 [Verrucomicrobia bacterium]|nr:MAG: hypothetical protein EAZ42_00845 [Verrucomicrobiota bacterium]